eukprot:TRINITY_DN91250_c0_g1_i1.p1 TRINITY_DN91250_c0_g1~~TRINITY_DN91250_c0_g1_i1.p1  ORF type:complete len:639 (-),score=81.76 TRINITY_DN91250_c0_g1_i1:263-2080(-)
MLPVEAGHRHVTCQRPTVPQAWKQDFPPFSILEARQFPHWLESNLPPMKEGDQSSSTREKALARLSAQEYIAMRKARNVTCEEYTNVLVKRVHYYKYMNAFMYWDIMPDWTDFVLDKARALDAKAAAEGVQAIAPLYGLPLPVKGTMATIDFPSSAGSGLLHNCWAQADSDMVKLIYEANGIVFGKTNVPEFACSYMTGNYANGLALNPYSHRLITGGSSGGSGAAVATYLAPIAVTEDTSGSTRNPAFHNQNFGYDPSRNHFPNVGNPGWSLLKDQVGLNARSFEDILFVDAALLGTQSQHVTSAAVALPASQLRVGLPRRPFLEEFNGTGWFKISSGLEEKYNAAKAALKSAGVQLVDGEWSEYPTSTEASAEHLLSWYEAQCADDLDGLKASWMAEYLHAPFGWAEVGADMEYRRYLTPGSVDDHYGLETPAEYNQSHETVTRKKVASQSRIISLYNSIFDRLQVDVLMTPPQLPNAVSYVDAASANIPVTYEDAFGNIHSLRQGTMGAMAWFYGYFKCIPVPKLVVPTGLDDQGRPTSVEFWGRAMPSERIFDDDFAKTYDLTFLYQARALVESLHSDPSLRRVDAPLVNDLFEEKSDLMV